MDWTSRISYVHTGQFTEATRANDDIDSTTTTSTTTNDGICCRCCKDGRQRTWQLLIPQCHLRALVIS